MRARHDRPPVVVAPAGTIAAGFGHCSGRSPFPAACRRSGRVAAASRVQRGRRPGVADRRGRSGTTRSAGSGGGAHPAIIRTHSRALAPGATPGNRRRNSTMAESSPSSVNTRRMAAASASSTANMRRTMVDMPPSTQAPSMSQRAGPERPIPARRGAGGAASVAGGGRRARSRRPAAGARPGSAPPSCVPHH